LPCRTPGPQLFAAENDHGLAEHRRCNLAYGLGAGCAAYEEEPFWPSTVEHQSLETLGDTAEDALHRGAGDMSGRRISLRQPVDSQLARSRARSDACSKYGSTTSPSLP
jgi:hypothetical protein